MKSLIHWMERVGALLLFVIMVVIATTTVTRYLFYWPIPDGDSIARMLLAVLLGLVRIPERDKGPEQ